jgi:hypothetical protein
VGSRFSPMGYSKADIEEARRRVDQAKGQVDLQAEMILRMRRSGLSTAVAEAALETMATNRDRMQARLREMRKGVANDNS